MSVRKIIQAAASSTTTSTPAVTYVDDVFSTYLYTGNSGDMSANVGVDLTGTPTNGTVLHITGDTVYDYAPNPNKFTVYGNLAANTTTKKYGAGSLSFDGAGDYLIADYNSALNVGSGDFTLEFWMYINALPTAWKRVFSVMNPAIAVASDEGILIEISNTNKIAAVFTSGSTAYNITDPTTATATTWTHWAMVKSGTAMTLYRDGTSVGTVSIPVNTVVNFNSNFRLYLGRWPGDVARDFNGYIDDLRLIVGGAKYTGNFTAPTTALPLDSLTSGGGLVWLKERTATGNNGSHWLFDSVQGFSASTSTNATGSNAGWGPGVQFTQTGYRIGGNIQFNTSGSNYASWIFKKSSKFFDVVKYIGDGTTGRLISHSLGITPGMIIIKSTSATGDWLVAHRAYGGLSGEVAGYNLTLNTTTGGGSWLISNTGLPASPSTVFKVDNLAANNAGTTYIAYLFAHDTSTNGTIQCGSYTTDASGVASVNLGWEPQFLICKSATGTSNWWIGDVMRGMTVDNSTAYLSANTSNAEVTGTLYGVTSTGFNAVAQNASQTYVYVAIRRSNKPPAKSSDVFEAASGYTSYSTGTVVASDLMIQKGLTTSTTTVNLGYVVDRLRGIAYSAVGTSTNNSNPTLALASTAIEATNTSKMYQNKMQTYVYSDAGGNAWYNFKRAFGFFDIVCDTGDGATTRAISHNLGVTPELMIRKPRSEANSWWVYHKSLADINSFLILQSTQAAASDSTAALWGSTQPTATTFNVGYGTINYDNKPGITYVTYLFATLGGISKVGSYTGNGSVQTINCGFAAGARFILIKCTSAVSDWYIWDNARGIVTANDPHLSLNTTAAEVTTDNSIDPDTSGFIVNQVAATNINVTSATYIFLAIA